MQITEDKLSAICEGIYGGAFQELEAIKLVREATRCGLEAVNKPLKSSTPASNRGCARALMAVMPVQPGAAMVTRNQI